MTSVLDFQDRGYTGLTDSSASRYFVRGDGELQEWPRYTHWTSREVRVRLTAALFTDKIDESRLKCLITRF